MVTSRTDGKRERPAIVEEDRFLQAVLANPDDASIRLVYADWLEERGDPRGEFLRLEAALMYLPREDERWAGLAARLRQLRPTLAREWLTALDQVPIELCDQVFEFRCPKRWDRLQLTEDVAVRFCGSCRQRVRYCTSLDEARAVGALGTCVALDPGVLRTEGDLDAARHRRSGELVLGRLPLGPPLTGPEWFRPGRRVRVREGALAGFEGEIERVQTNARAWIGLTLLGRRTSVELESWQVEPMG
jgi:uncharacterized protein (TIGR02996 family)